MDIHKFLGLVIIGLACAISISCQSLRDQEPLGIHIVYGIEPSHQVNVIWWTKIQTVSALVYYGLVEPENDNVPIESLSCKHNRFTKGYLARNATNGKFIQRVFLNNLEPNRRYCYEITSGDASSHIYAFRTASHSNLIGVKNKDTFHSSFLVFGSDMAPTLTTQNNNHQNSDSPESFSSHLDSMLASFKEEILNRQINGFLNLPTVHLKEYSEATTVNDQDFFDYYSSVLSNVQILPALSQMGDSISRNLFQSMFPLKGSVPFNSYFYSLNMNGVHFLSYSADLFTIKTKDNGLHFDASAAALLETQINTIAKDLAKANENRHLVPWIIVLASQSLKCQQFACQSNTNDIFKKKLESIFYKYNVDLILESSSHLYERSFPVLRSAKKYQTNYEIPEMPVYLSLPKYSVGVNQETTDKWSAFRYQPHVDNTYGLLEIINATFIKWSYVYSNKTVIDQLSLTKDHTGVFHRIMKSHKELLELNNLKESDAHSYRPITLIFIIFALTAVIGYVTVRRRLREKRLQKINSNYSNLIESEFDT